MLRELLGLPRTPKSNEGAAAGTPAPTGNGAGTAPVPGAATTSDGETATVRAIAAKLDAMPRDQARYLAAFAYILSRAANADLSVSDAETRRMEQIVVEHGHIEEAQAVLVVEIAKTRSDLFGATEDYLVTREFRRIATDDQCLDVLRCCFLVGVEDGSISAEESDTLRSIGDELQVDPEVVRQIRASYADKFSAVQAMRQLEA